MKAIVLFSLLILVAMACGRDLNPLLDMTILKDSTDEINPLSYEDVRQFLDYSDPELLWYEATIRQRELTHIRHGKLSETHLPAGKPNAITEQQRKMMVRRFLKETEAMMNQELPDGRKAQSHLYYGIAEELNRLSKSQAIHRVALISSDLLENTHTFSVYRPQDRKLLMENPDSVIDILIRELPLQDLSGVQVYIVYQATPEDHELFTAMSRLYDTMLSRNNAQVIIAGNLIPKPLTAP